jgi:surfeit locus 1 family protein
MLRLLFSRQWWFPTLLVMAACGVMARLGFWQLDRLAQRRAFNARVTTQLAAPLLALTSDLLNLNLFDMEYRTVVVVGEYDHAQQTSLRNQAWDDGHIVLAGVHLLTPLIIAGTDRAVLVDRGWIPLVDSAPDRWGRYDERGPVTVRGVIRRSESKADFGSITDPAGRLSAWNLANVTRIAEQVTHPLLPVYIQQAPDPAWTELPYRSQPDLDLSEGPHLGYALQWFGFALVLAMGYPLYARNTHRLDKTETASVMETLSV